MEMITKNQIFMPNSTSPSLTMHKDSRTISKVKPKIRIIHIFAPEIIKTDVANFRELVQRLTGKPTDQKGNRKKKPRMARRKDPRSTLCCSDDKPAKMELRVKEEEEEIWRVDNSGGFLSGFADLDGFMQELGEFPLLPMDASHMHVFGETQLLS